MMSSRPISFAIPAASMKLLDLAVPNHTTVKGVEDLS
jgi:hypothetical protein